MTRGAIASVVLFLSVLSAEGQLYLTRPVYRYVVAVSEGEPVAVVNAVVTEMQRYVGDEPVRAHENRVRWVSRNEFGEEVDRGEMTLEPWEVFRLVGEGSVLLESDHGLTVGEP